MSDQIPPVPPLPQEAVPQQVAPATSLAQTSALSDGEWHRMHALTPLLKGGVALLIILGVLVANFRDMVIAFVTRVFIPQAEGFVDDGAPDVVGWVFANNLVLLVLGGLIVVVLLIIVLFWVSWRFHQFRITEDDVEVRSGVLFRTQRRAPLDRVQGVNLTRPVIARLIGLAKLEVVGAGDDANVKLEYLTTTNAETVRSDILRLASGRQLRAEQARADQTGGSRVQRVARTVSGGLDGIVQGVDHDVAPESVVNLPPQRLIAAHLLSGQMLALVIAIVAIVVGAIIGTAWILFGMIPVVLAFGGYTVSQILKSLRYSIAPTPNGVRVTFGLLTTVTETIPPGRIHAVEITQSIFWRPFGWWMIKINRISGKKAAEGQTDPFAIILPVGTRAEVDRVLALLLPPESFVDFPTMQDDGLLGPREQDPFKNSPARAWWVRPFSWRRNGFLTTSWGFLERRGRVWRKLAVFPYARMQSVSVQQGPFDRLARVATLRVHTVQGAVIGILSAIDRDVVMDVFGGVAAASVTASAADTSHRWAGDAPEDDTSGIPFAPLQDYAAPPVTVGPDTPAPEHADEPGAPAAAETVPGGGHIAASDAVTTDTGERADTDGGPEGRS